MLKGTIEDFTLSDIFRLLSSTKKTGKLEVIRSAGDGRVFFRDGDVYFAQSSIKREPLGQRLIAAGALTESVLMRALDLNAQTGERTGEILLRQASITEEQLIAAVRGQIQDAALDLLRWEVGAFEFESGERFSLEIPISVSVDSLIMEASRRLEELEVIKKRLPSNDVIITIAPPPPEGGRDISLTPDEERLLLLVDGHRTVGEILDEANLDEFSGFRTLYGLVSSGLADVVTLGPAPKPPRIAPPPIGSAAGADAEDFGMKTVVGSREFQTEDPDHAAVEVDPELPTERRNNGVMEQAGGISNGVALTNGEVEDSIQIEKEPAFIGKGEEERSPPLDVADDAPAASNVDRAMLVRELASLFNDEESRILSSTLPRDTPPEDSESSTSKGRAATPRRSLLRRRTPTR